MMKKIQSMPTSKIQRAAKLVGTGVKLGGNYVKYYGEKIINPEQAKQNLDKNNAEDIYDSLKDLKGSALKVAQMLSMEKNMLPAAYVEQFSLSQFSVPPISGPLVAKTFKNYFGKAPGVFFDSFSTDAIHAASIGQVHKATKDGKTLAVKIQYPAVADSIQSDLKLVKPIALKMFNLPSKDSDKYFKEVENKLLEETDYSLELKQSLAFTTACSGIKNMRFPGYYPEYSNQKVLTMDWMDGIHLSEFTAQNTDIDKRNSIGQALWDFYMYQMHGLKKVHADPHPGNFLVSKDTHLIAIDFGCIKTIPEDFYVPYFELSLPENLNNPTVFKEKLYDLEILTDKDTAQETVFFSEMFHEMLSVFTQPFQQEYFDFSDAVFFSKIAALGQQYAKNSQLKKMNSSRGSTHFIYINRTFFGLYNLLHDLKATIHTTNYKQYL